MQKMIQSSRPETIFINPSRISAYMKAVQGTRTETRDLNINLKTLIVRHLLQAVLSHEVSSVEKQIIAKYIKMPASFKSFSFLSFTKSSQEDHSQIQSLRIARKNIKNILIRYFKSTQFIRTILSSEKMQIAAKKHLIKYVNRIIKISEQKSSLQWKCTLTF